jgi:ribonuclease T1
MSQITSRTAKTLLALLIALLGSVGLATSAPAETASAPVTALQASCGDTSGFQVVALSSLPPQATDTVALIHQGGPYPYSQDGQTFGNREKILPACATGYYKEYTVKTPGSSTRGARRIVTGSGGEHFYTGDHYASFQLVDINRW